MNEPASSRPVRLFHVSDLHFGREDRVALEWFAGLVAEQRPDAVVMTGDLTMRARAREYAAAEAWLGKLGVPVSVEVGNHDLPYFNPIARFVSPYKRFRRLERAVERPLNLPGVWLVPLRTITRAQWRTNWSWGVVRRKALEEALAVLAACPAGHVALVAAHHPLISEGGSRTRARTIGGEEALERLAACGADAVLSGHVHDPFDLKWRTARRSIRLIGAGTLSERLRGSLPSFNELVIENGAIDVRPRMMSAQEEGQPELPVGAALP